ncbi:TonB-dependent receptor plug domain-containing protein [Undibacterium sp. B2R-29]|nr:TonB-dependent receptor plug domain-containing protein [Undibacterium crateris]
MLKKTLVARALTLAFGVGVASFAYTPDVMAQSNAAGTAYGKVGAGVATNVVLKNVDTNFTRSVSIDATGKFQATALPAGRYQATLIKEGKTLGTVELDVLIGQGAEVDFGAQTTGVQSVEVSARRSKIDVSSATNGATFTAKELAKLPVAHNVDAIIQLAPNTTRSDPTYAAGASFGGGAASENAYYINGFPVTNPLTQLGASELPFGAISQAQILTGGFGAEFGRSTGGVVNITTKGGTNNWEVGASASIIPNALRSNPVDIYYPNTGRYPYKVVNGKETGTDGSLAVRRENNTYDQKQLGGYVGGPIIQDKLFMFVALEGTQTDTGSVNVGRTSTTSATNGWQDATTKLTRYYGKLDWNINDDHRLELTAFGDKPKTDTSYRGYNYATRTIDNAVTSSLHEDNNGANGGDVQILRYVGNITDNLVVTGLYGQSKSKHIYQPAGYNPNLFQVAYDTGADVSGLNYKSPQGFSGNLPFSGSTDEIKSYRLDIEYKLGQHTLRAGLDNNKLTSLNAGDSSAGGGLWSYHKIDPTAIISGSNMTQPIGSFGGLAAQGYYVEKILSSTVSNAYSDQSAQYIEDKYQVTKDVLLTFGLRNEQFSNANQDKVKYIEMKNQIAPRFSAAWDVNGDSSMKVFGSAGRYSVQMPTVVALRGANGSLNTNQFFTYTGTDANGIPTGTTQLTAPISGNNEFGQAKDPKTITALNLKPSFQDELTLGFEKAYSQNLNFGAKFTYRMLRATIDDFCDQRPFDAWAKRKTVDTSNWNGFGCASFNPGEANSFLVDFNDADPAKRGKNYTRVDLSKEDLGFEKAERKYYAVDLFLEHPYRNGWYGKVNYTWSRNTGNTEGQTASDFNTAQGDISTTQTWDNPEVMKYANGLLPNNRTHQIKAFGFYELTPEWTVGANLLLASGRPRSCVSRAADPAFGINPAYTVHYCFGATKTANVPSPRGTVGNLEWDRQLDLNLTYKPQFLKGLALKVDVFNVFNAQTVQKVSEEYMNRAGTISSTYERVISYSSPRFAKLTAEYNYKF